MQLTKVNLVANGYNDTHDGVGAYFADVFIMQDGTVKEVETTREEYIAISDQNIKRVPTIDGGQWNKSFSDNRYDTPNGRMSDLQYYADGTSGLAIVRLGNASYVIRDFWIVNGDLNDLKYQELTAI